MIISHKYKFIFIKTNKTAGTSIEIALSKFCGPEDIITPISLEDEIIRKQLGYRGPQNYLAPFRKYNFADWLLFVFKRKKKLLFYNHISGKEIIDIIGDKKWHEYFSFCFERNPAERLISLYYWRNKNNKFNSIGEFLKSQIPQILKKRGYYLYTYKNKILVDYVGKYEKLDEEMSFIRNKLNIPEHISLPNAKSGYRPENDNIELSDEEKSLLKSMFAEEIELFGYNIDNY
jgi:hypothetical protein